MEEKTKTRHAIIDVGSNTIRTVIYAIDRENHTAEELISERDFTGIIAYVKYGRLCEAGRLQLVEVLTRMKEFCEIADCHEISCFSTASLRGAENFDEILASVRAETGITIRPLSAEEETFYDLAGLLSGNVAPAGTGLDLGGGSCQIFHYDENGFRASASLKIGCLTLSNAFVDGIFPTKSEAKKIREKVRKAISEVGDEMRVPAGTFAYAMGGTARAAARIHNVLSGAMKTDANVRLSREAMADIIEFSQDDAKECLRLLSRVAPSRMHTLVPGVIVLRTLCKTLGADGVEVVRTGIREGYLHREILGAQTFVPAQ